MVWFIEMFISWDYLEINYHDQCEWLHGGLAASSWLADEISRGLTWRSVVLPHFMTTVLLVSYGDRRFTWRCDRCIWMECLLKNLTSCSWPHKDCGLWDQTSWINCNASVHQILVNYTYCLWKPYRAGNSNCHSDKNLLLSDERRSSAHLSETFHLNCQSYWLHDM